MNKKQKGCLVEAAVAGAAVLAAYGLVRATGDVAHWIGERVYLRPAEEVQTDIILPESGIGRKTSLTVTIPTYGRPVEAESERELLRVWFEDDSPLPDWWDPDSAELVWEDHSSDSGKMVGDFAGDINVPCKSEPHPPEGIDPGGIDWNICSTIWGWDGHGAETWELDLMARIFYLEFWGTSIECSEAGCDAILNLWDTGKYGKSLFEALSYYDPDYGYTYRVYPKVWQTDYDADGLAWCKEFCEERFVNGPEWEAVYFQLGGYHDPEWVSPLYELDGVYFSAGSRW